MRATNADALLPPAPAASVQRTACSVQRTREAAFPRLPTSGRHGAPGFHAVLLACGNPLRQDDGVGWRIAEAAERMAEQDFPDSHLRIVAAQQWTPEMAEELAEAELAIFVDASATDEPGAIRVKAVETPTSGKGGQIWGTQFSAETHSLDPAALLALAEQVCGRAPARAFLLTVGAESFDYGEAISVRVRQAVPRVVRLVGNLLTAFAIRQTGDGDDVVNSSLTRG